MIFKTRVACARKTASCVYTILKKNLIVVCCWLIINYISPHDLHNEQLCYKLAVHLSTRWCPCSRVETRRSHIGDLEYHKDRESCHSQVTVNQSFLGPWGPQVLSWIRPPTCVKHLDHIYRRRCLKLCQPLGPPDAPHGLLNIALRPPWTL